MDNLYNEYDKYLKDGKWCYYHDLEKDYKNKDIKYLLTHSEEFIKAYFKTGLKGGALNPELLTKLKEKRRLPHVVSTFVLGIILKEQCTKIKDALDSKCSEFQKLFIKEWKQNHVEGMNLSDPFTFTWFLTCLGHDIGYFFESEDVKEKPSSLIGSIKNLDNYLSEDQMENYLPPDKNAIVPEKLKKHCVPYYKAGIAAGDKFRGRRGKRCRDHGISGGIVYYNLLKDNYENVKKNSNYKDSDCFVENDRLWSKKILETYIAAGSWAIICHNIWLRNPSDPDKRLLDVYKSRGLSELITDEPLIKVSEHPFLFLLTLADTLEPIKEKENLERILQKSKMSFNKDGFSIKSHPRNALDLWFLGIERKGETYRIC